MILDIDRQTVVHPNLVILYNVLSTSTVLYSNYLNRNKNRYFLHTHSTTSQADFKFESDTVMDSISMQCRHSSNTWDRYHSTCTVDDKECSFFSDPPSRYRYLSVELDARESWTNTR